MDDFEREIKIEFIKEATANLEETEGSFMELESSSDPTLLLQGIFRLAHNLKGGARAVGFADVAEFTHHLENLVKKLQDGQIQLSGKVVTLLLRSNDRLVEMLSALKSDMDSNFDNADLLVEIEAWTKGVASEGNLRTDNPTVETNVSAEVPSAEVPSQELQLEPSIEDEIPASDSALNPPPSAEAFFDDPVSSATALPNSAKAPEPTSSPAQRQPESKPSESRAAPTDDEVIRVGLSRINLLNDYVGELIVLQSVVQQQAAMSDQAKLFASIRQVAKLSKDIQSLSMSLRMLPVKPLIQKLQRVARDTAMSLGKEVEMMVEGDQLEIDKSVLDRLADPLIHIVRNAVDHGLETSDDRAVSGKGSKGNVFLSFANEGNHLIVEVRDDGKGIHAENLRAKAIEKGVISANQQLTEKQIIHLIFHPGFSTKAVASEISGRGVGMDVVKTNVERIGGAIEISTKPGEGTCFRLQIPLSLAVIEGLVVSAGTQRFVVPLNQVQQTVNLKNQKLFLDKTGIGSCCELRGTVVPLIHIQEALGTRGHGLKNDLTAMIISVEDRLVGLVVSDILRAQQIVIKPLGNGIRPQNGWVGSCVLGDGLPTLILSPVDLLREHVKTSVPEVGIGGQAA